MADFNKSMQILKRLEFSDDKTVLHKNKNESGLTYYGIYEGANPHWSHWSYIHDIIRQSPSLSVASRTLYANKELEVAVYSLYKARYWDKMQLNRLHSQRMADELFIFGVNAGVLNAARLAQKLLGIKRDGIVGEATIKALNSYDEAKFNIEFDEAEIAFYSKLINANPKLKIYANGWRNRALAV
ncbi:peptidoglycan domain protein [Campylobacter sp. faydin G-24]|uniref:Peptidoglycan domain protein n=1 Tax=Campylobacter anatolicus TaxID=2829105 RepID=A0ABS5HKQ3_9BACT|nr:putative peptidoglycan-binding domain-containing protein [Campylobacter anatolicus]MBR8464262.1 peptidoglycan domain protein [Campylobacter anatolicus]